MARVRMLSALLFACMLCLNGIPSFAASSIRATYRAARQGASLPAWGPQERERMLLRLDGFLDRLQVSQTPPNLETPPEVALSPHAVRALAAEDLNPAGEDPEYAAQQVITAFITEPELRLELWADLNRMDETDVRSGLKTRVVGRMNNLANGLERQDEREASESAQALETARSILIPSEVHGAVEGLSAAMARTYDGRRLVRETYGDAVYNPRISANDPRSTLRASAKQYRRRRESSPASPAAAPNPDTQAQIFAEFAALIMARAQNPVSPLRLFQALGAQWNHSFKRLSTDPRLQALVLEAAFLRKHPNLEFDPESRKGLIASIKGIALELMQSLPPMTEQVFEYAITRMFKWISPGDPNTYAENFGLNPSIPLNFPGIAGQFSAEGEREIRVYRLERYSEAYYAGLRIGDRVLSVNGHAVTDHNVFVEQAQAQGEGEITLEIERQGEPAPISIEFYAQAAEAWIRDIGDGVHYAGFTEFQLEAAHLLRDLIDAHAAGRVSGVILDLRGNTGGSLAYLNQWARAFGHKGDAISWVEDASGFIRGEFLDSDGPLADLPLTVLIDEETSSSAEHFAGFALDNGIATLIGRPSYGKSWGQNSNFYEGFHFSIRAFNWAPPKGWRHGARRIIPHQEVAWSDGDSERRERQFSPLIWDEPVEDLLDDPDISAGHAHLTGAAGPT